MSKTYGLSENASTMNEALYSQKSEIASVSSLFDRFIKEKSSFRTSLKKPSIPTKKFLNAGKNTLKECQRKKRFWISSSTWREAGLSVTTCNIYIRSFNSFLTGNTFAKIELEKSTFGVDFINLVNATEHRCYN